MTSISQWCTEFICLYFSSVQFSRSVVSNLCDPMDCSTPGFPVLHHLQGLLKLMSIQSVMPSNHLILCHPLLHLPSIFPNVKVFFSESALCIRWPKYWSFSISPSNEHSALISFRIDCFDLLASILRHSAFFGSNSHIH